MPHAMPTAQQRDRGMWGLRPIFCNGRTAAAVVRRGARNQSHAMDGTKAGRGCSTMQSSVRSAVANAILDKIPQALKSMYYAENELRRALFKGVMQRSDEARQHLAEARRHFDEMLGARNPETVNPPTPTESNRAAPRKDGEF